MRSSLTDSEVMPKSTQAYGSPRITAEIKSRGIPVSKDRVRRLMKEHGIRARGKRKYKATTENHHKLPVAPNLLKKYGMHPSMSRKGNCWDNAVMEIFDSLKNERRNS